MPTALQWAALAKPREIKEAVTAVCLLPFICFVIWWLPLLLHCTFVFLSWEFFFGLVLVKPIWKQGAWQYNAPCNNL